MAQRAHIAAFYSIIIVYSLYSYIDRLARRYYLLSFLFLPRTIRSKYTPEGQVKRK